MRLVRPVVLHVHLGELVTAAKGFFWFSPRKGVLLAMYADSPWVTCGKCFGSPPITPP